MRERLSIELPEKLSALIRVALGDLNRVEKDPNYKIDMSEWHVPEKRMRLFMSPDGLTGFALKGDENGVCRVCLAGAVMTRVLDKDSTSFDIFDEATDRKFSALNSARVGCVASALCCLDNSLDYAEVKQKLASHEIHINNMYVTPYNQDPDIFKKTMRYIADSLESIGW